MQSFANQTLRMGQVIKKNRQMLKTQNIGLRRDMLLNIVILKSEALTNTYKDRVKGGESIGLNKLFEDQNDFYLRKNLYRIYQISQEPGTLNFVKSRLAASADMLDLENRTLLEKYGIQEHTIFLSRD